ncbi:type-F conjugative transfer system pilin assembly protein TrbC [Rahnella variigena]|uniref:type-F conjugative transfer system pilin assembly protein TrbC n=1 Tax=Rahnella variigena TaxID=574964 RepID=UPI00133113D1|nr:type-F conjugative transfer system pilin assembly protein TrbC [Rahnella variigena]
MKKYRALLLASFFALPAYAAAAVQDDQQFINDQLRAGEAMRHAPVPDFLKSLPANPALSAPQQSFIEGLRSDTSQAMPEKTVPQALYFVSFSMPEDGLKALVLEADRLRIPATLRGLINNDFRQTANAVLKLVNDDKRGGVQVDPTAYKTYGITAVPALVVTCNGHFDRVGGNIAPVQALRKIAESGDCSSVAKQLLTAAGESL